MCTKLVRSLLRVRLEPYNGIYNAINCGLWLVQWMAIIFEPKHSCKNSRNRITTMGLVNDVVDSITLFAYFFVWELYNIQLTVKVVLAGPQLQSETTKASWLGQYSILATFCIIRSACPCHWATNQNWNHIPQDFQWMPLHV